MKSDKKPFILFDNLIEETDELQAYVQARPVFFTRVQFELFEKEHKDIETVADFIRDCDPPDTMVPQIKSSEGNLTLANFKDVYDRQISILVRNIELDIERKFNDELFDYASITRDRKVRVTLEYQIIADNHKFVNEEKEWELIRNFTAVLLYNRIRFIESEGLLMKDYRVH